jgi:hypothetical protein
MNLRDLTSCYNLHHHKTPSKNSRGESFLNYGDLQDRVDLDLP